MFFFRPVQISCPSGDFNCLSKEKKLCYTATRTILHFQLHSMSYVNKCIHQKPPSGSVYIIIKSNNEIELHVYLLEVYFDNRNVLRSRD